MRAKIVEHQTEPPDDVGALSMRRSIHDIRSKFHDTFGEDLDDLEDDRNWSLPHLMKIFRAEEKIQQLFDLYLQRLHQSFFALLNLIQSGLFFLHFVALMIFSSNLTSSLVDLTVYMLMVCLSMTVFFLTDGCRKNSPSMSKPKMILLTSFLFLILQLVNIGVPLYYFFNEEVRLRPAYSTQIVISCYVFFFVSNFAANVTMGLLSTLIDVLILVYITYGNLDASQLRPRIITDVIYLVCINGLGIHYRYLNEIIKRKSFLDRRACVIFNRHLKFQKDQGEILMNSLIPNYVAHKVKDKLLRDWQNIRSGNNLIEHKAAYTQTFDNVTILFADVVNYTEMTVKLKTNELVETLNELFGNFDDASLKYGVLRIKFLGDCYYCAAGLPPDPPDNHAEACVDLGLDMIEIIAEVRKRRHININMRIGIHTGKIISGIIGYQKFHFDIWSKDVSLANQMETEGVAGKVHITQYTKTLLKKQYNLVPTNKGDVVPSFIKEGLKTYLISPETQKNSVEKKTDISNIYLKKRITNNISNKRVSFPKPTKSLSLSDDNNTKGSTDSDNHQLNEKNVKYYGLIETSYIESEKSINDGINTVNRRATPMKNSKANERIDSRDSQRRTAFMNSNIKMYTETMKETYGEMRKALNDLCLTKYQQWFVFKDIHPFTLFFTNFKREVNFITMHDPLFKYYILSGLLLLQVVYVIQNVTFSKWNWNALYTFISSAIMLFIFLPLTWIGHVLKHKSNKICMTCVSISKHLMNSVIFRILIYSIVCILFTLCVFSELINCYYFNNDDGVSSLRSIQRSFIILLTERKGSSCIVPWHMTQTCSVTIIMSFLFLRMLLWIKFAYALLITTLYCTCVYYFSEDTITIESDTFNHNLSSKVSHILAVIFLTATLHIIDRQTEYMNRLDFLWKEKVKEEKVKLEEGYIVNKMLLNNILPEHLTDMYLNIRRPAAALYHEIYPNAAVMFASVVGYQNENLQDSDLLELMSEIIGGFDKLIEERRSINRPIEKIKVAKWTYMAACGISPGTGDVEDGEPSEHVESLLQFASAMMVQLRQLNKEYSQNLKLRVGISNGEIVAGVVGSSKPLYDIWGDPVNMAARMDTTGEFNKIHVLERTANVIMTRGYQCTLRGNTFVKGLKDPVPTYFVDLDENFELIQSKTKLYTNEETNF